MIPQIPGRLPREKLSERARMSVGLDFLKRFGQLEIDNARGVTVRQQGHGVFADLREGEQKDGSQGLPVYTTRFAFVISLRLEFRQESGGELHDAINSLIYRRSGR